MITSFLDEEPTDTDRRTHVIKFSQRTDIMPVLDMRVYNSYTQSSPVQTGTYLYPWDYMAEPYRPQQLQADGYESGSWLKWIVDGHTQGYGSSVSVMFTSVGYTPVVLIEKGSNATTICATKVMVKYVRREVRSLSDLDRELFFSAIMTMQRVPTEVGQRIYGSKFKSKDYFNRVHLYYGGTADCDHWHQGAGFVTPHMAFTLEFEQSLQSINPRSRCRTGISRSRAPSTSRTSWRASPIFADDWFGVASPDNDLAHGDGGPLGVRAVDDDAWDFSEVHNRTARCARRGTTIPRRS